MTHDHGLSGPEILPRPHDTGHAPAEILRKGPLQGNADRDTPTKTSSPNKE
jgi:hypothetical protein